MSWDDFNVFYCIIISAVKFTHIFYRFNQNTYRTKWFTILESQFMGNPEIFWTKRDFWFLHYILCMGGIHCCDIMSELLKYENLPQFNADWLASLKTWYYFRLCFSFNFSGFDLTVIKPKSLILFTSKNCFQNKCFLILLTKKKFWSKKWWGD